jgi:IS1 family transposase
MNKLTGQRREQVIRCLIEGCSIRSTVRVTGVAKKTVMRLLVEVGAVCSEYQDRVFRNLKLTRIQCDEIWTFVYAKQKNVTARMLERGHVGDVWTWVAIDAETKLVPCWMVGGRDAGTAKTFIDDLAGRLTTRVQLTTDGHKAYLGAIEDAFGCAVDYAILIKLYGNEPETEVRYSPAQCIGTRTEIIMGRPEPEHISTSYVERQNLTMRMCMRRFTRLTNAFSKKIENHAAAIALHYFAYNFIKIHRTLRCTPAMAAGVTDRLWDVADLVALWEAEERSRRSVA